MNCLQIFLLTVSLLLAGHTFPAPPEKGLGINLTHHRYFSASIPFVDVFKKTKPWINSGKGGDISVNADGWVASLEPGQKATAMVFNNLNGHYPTGVYHLFYEGKGLINVGAAASVISRKTGYIKVRVISKNSGIRIHIKATDKDNPIRNIRLIIPGHEDTYQEQPFYPPYVNLIKQFNVIRFMDWMQTNESHVVDWSDRTPANYATQDMPAGVAAEWIIKLANTAQVDPWITIPHKANDGYVRKLAELYKEQLDPKLKVYLEYSNEVWNGSFDQFHYAQAKGAELGNRKGSAFLTFYSHRAVEIFDIWTDVFGGADRVVRVMAGQAANPFTGKKALSHGDAYKKTDAYAIAPYISLGRDFNKESTDPDYLLGVLNKRLHAFNQRKLIDTLKMAKKFDIPVIAYEGGQHVYGRTPSGEDRCTSVNRAEGMEQLYSNYLAMWRKYTENNLFLHFNDLSTPSRWGCWGMKEWLDQPDTPKYKAILKQLNQAAYGK